MNAAEELSSKLAGSTCIAQPWEDIFSGRTTRLLAACKIFHHTTMETQNLRDTCFCLLLKSNGADHRGDGGALNNIHQKHEAMTANTVYVG